MHTFDVCLKCPDPKTNNDSQCLQNIMAKPQWWSLCYKNTCSCGITGRMGQITICIMHKLGEGGMGKGGGVPFSVKKNTSSGNKKALTGPANCKKTTRHHVHLWLCAKSRKTNDAKSRKWPKTSIWAIFWRFQGQISPNCKFFWKIGFIQIEGHI